MRHWMADSQLSKKDRAAIQKLAVNRRWDAVLRLGSLLIGRGSKWLFFGWLVYQGRIGAEAFAGKVTATSLIISLGATLSAVIGVSWATTICFAVWVFFERRLRKNTVERLSLRVKEMELQLDRGRSSSQLTPRGDTRPEDET
jgi:hypothetical protein